MLSPLQSPDLNVMEEAEVTMRDIIFESVLSLLAVPQSTAQYCKHLLNQSASKTVL